MKFGVPWSVKGIRPEARETAREAARRSGMSLGDWLTSVILHQAEQDGVDASGEDDDETYGADLSSVHERLDDIGRRIDRAARTGPAAYAPRHVRAEPDQLAEMINRLDRKLDQFATMTRPPAPLSSTVSPVMRPTLPPAAHLPPALDLAAAEISARQRALNGQLARQPASQPSVQPPAPQPQPSQPAMPEIVAAPWPPLPARDLSGLEQQLRTITSQIETLRKPGVEDAINALRDELAGIAYALTEAMPKHALDAIERQIAGLTQRIAEGRQAGVDGNALAGIEQGLAEVRDALHHLTPAENLVGFNDAINGLAHKIDMIVAQQDPATMQQLEHAVATLRDISAHVASNEMVGHLAAEVQRLSQSVEQIALASGGGDALAHLEQRINALSDALADRAQSGAVVPPQLETLVNSLSDKIEQVQLSRGDNAAIGHLEDRIATLMQKLDASDSRLGHLEAIERGLADLLVHIEDIKASKGAAAEVPAVDSLKSEIARTQDALGAVHDTLGDVVDRLAMIEQGMHRAPHPAPPAASHAAADEPVDLTEPLDLKEPIGKLAVRLIDAASAPPIAPGPMAETPPPPRPAPQPQPAMAEPSPPRRMPARRQLPIDPDLPPDQPLEPGSGPPTLRANPAARIAASEAALGGTRPAGPATGLSNKSNFIAAARRAAQAATQERPVRAPRSAADFMHADTPKARTSLFKRVKSLFVAASVIAIVIGGVQIASNFVDLGGPNDKFAQVSDVVPKKTVEKEPTDRIEAPATVAAATEPAPLPPTAAAPEAPRPSSGPAGLPSVALVQPGASGPTPALWSAPGANLPGFATGSISRPAAALPAAPQSPLALPPARSGEQLPAAIGGVRLRSAASAGDAAAAYEVGVRFAEGRGVPADMGEAARWLERAAAKGLAPAQFRYGSLLEKGHGAKKDIAQARRLYLAAAAAGNAKAMHNLAVLYAEGVDGKPDYNVAAQWFHKAAMRGIPDSQFNLGVLYARGLGVATNMAESYKWFALAAIKGDKEAVKKRDEIASRLDAQALASTQLAVKGFIAETQPDSAINVPTPQGGWDNASTVPAHVKPRTAGPLVLGKS
jgi:localization factor PodJL